MPSGVYWIRFAYPELEHVVLYEGKVLGNDLTATWTEGKGSGALTYDVGAAEATERY